MANNEAGAFLNITPDVLNKLDSFDKKLEQIEKHSKTAADALKNGFSSVVVDTSKLESAITSLANKIGALNTASNSVGNIGTAAQGSARGVSSMNESLSRAAQLLNQIGNNRIGQSSFSGWNIAGLKEGISDLKRFVENTKNISRQQQQAAVDAMRYMKMELDYQRQTDEQRAQSAEKAAQRKSAADRRAAKEAEELAKRQRSTPQGALDYSKNAKSLRDQVNAINYLKQARLSLDTTDAKYKQTLEQINSAIARHNQTLQQAGVQSQSLARNHRNLMDTAGQLQRKLALVFSVSQIEGYISKLASVRGEFELQQRSLQAILQNKAQADQIFNKTVQLAVKSPFQIKELVTFTKQLAAYRIESDKLYDTTKRLADVSAGLGVDMGRLILAYGQVKAAAYLRGTEVRQFTEAGINLYGELQRYFQEVKGEAYTTAQIVDMISKRKVTFEDIENIFQRLTDKGGLFYNMQEIQAETLQGKISNLKDSIDVMLNSIGKDNEGVLKGSIDAVKYLIDNWEMVASIGKSLVGVFALLYMHSLRTGVAMKAVFSTNMVASATKTLKSTELLANGFKSLSVAVKTFFTNLKAAFLTNLPALGIIAAITAISDAFTRLQNKSEAIFDVFKEMGEKKRGLYQISEAYGKIISASSNAKGAEISDTEEVINKKREQITKLIELYNKNGLKIDVELKEVPQSEFDEYFKKLYKGYADFIRLQESLRIALVENNGRIEGWFGMFGENIETDSKQLTNAYNNVIEKTRNVGNAISLLTNYYDNLSESQKKQYEQQYKGLIEASTRNAGESEIAYLERQVKAVNDFSKSIGATLDKSVIKAREYSMQFRIALTGAKGTGGYKEYLREFDNELDDILERVKSRYSEKEWDINGKVFLESVLDTEAASQGWEDWKIAHAKERWEIKPKIDEEETKKEMDGLDKIFKKWFSSHTYKLGIEYEDLGDKDAFKDFLEEGDTKAAAYKRAKEIAERLRNAMDSEFNQKQSGLTEEQWMNAFGIAEVVDKKTLIRYYEEQAKANKVMAESAGWREKKTGSKAERDIWSERISVLKEMQSRYEKLNQLMGENAAIEQTLSAFKPALKFTGMDKMNILPTKGGMIKAYEELLKDVTDSKKITELKKIIAELKIDIQEESLKNQLDKTKQSIESMFNGLDLHKKLKDAGLSEAEVQQLFPGLAKTLDDVQKGMEESYKKNFPKGEYLTEGTDANKQYKTDQDKLNQQRIKEQQDLVVELTKAYKTQLSDQLQLDRWYYEERAKIAKANLTEEQKEQYNKNLTKQYNEKSDENAWKQFQESDFYIDLFQNLDNVSTKTLVAMREKLADMKEQLKDLQPSQVRAIANNMEKLNEVLAGRNPFKELIPNLKSYIGSLKDRKKHEDEYISALEEQEKVEKRLYGYTKINEDGSKEKVIGESEVLAQLEAEYNAIVENKNATEEQKDVALEKLNAANEVVRKTEEELAKNKNITDEKKAQVDADRKKLDVANKSLNEVAKYGAEAVDAVSEFTGMLEGFGVEISEWLKGTTEGLGQIFDGLGSIDLTKPFSIVTGAFKTVAGIGKTIGSIFGIGNKDKKKEREIQQQIENVEKLQKAYEVLKEKMDEAWNSVTLHDTTKQTVANINQQISSYQQMIKAEQDKKKTDQAKIDEWNDAIKELEKTKQEILNQEKIEMGGIGGNSEYKSAAENFVQSWMNAFNETGKGMEGLEESFNSMIDNLIVKQATMRLAQGRLKRLFEEIDKSVTEGSEGGINLTKKELANINAIADTALSGLNDDLLSLLETLGYKGKGQTAELSALQQGIQAMSEETAGELQALLNSIRGFVSQQTTDISAIRTLLDARYGLETEYSDSNPMLVELRAQTGYLEQLTDYIRKVFAPSANSKGAGLRVFIG